jgi:hypothetical protein
MNIQADCQPGIGFVHLQETAGEGAGSIQEKILRCSQDDNQLRGLIIEYQPHPTSPW